MVILTKMAMLTKIAKNPQGLTCKSNEEAKTPPKKVANKARNRNGDFEGVGKFAEKKYRSNEVDEFGENGQMVNLSKKLPEGWRKSK